MRVYIFRRAGRSELMAPLTGLHFPPGSVAVHFNTNGINLWIRMRTLFDLEEKMD